MAADPDPVGELSRAPLEEFVRVRDELARRLSEEGKAEEAAALKRLRKPTLAAWGLNQLAHRHPKKVEWLLETHDKLRKSESGDAFRRAAAARQELVAELSDAAVGLLEEAGHSAGEAVRKRIGQTLLAVANDQEAEEALRTGRLERELVGSGWEAVGFPPEQPVAAEELESPRAERARQAREEADRLEAVAADLRERAEAARRRLKQAEKEVAAAVREAETADQRARRQGQRAERLEAQARDAGR